MKEISGTCKKVFAIINTTEYNNDGSYSVKVVEETELQEFGFVSGMKEEIYIKGMPLDRPHLIKDMDVNDVAECNESGCLLVRIA